MKKFFENMPIIDLLCTCAILIGYIITGCTYLYTVIPLNLIYGVEINILKIDFWQTILNFFYNIFVCLPFVISTVIVYFLKNSKLSVKNKIYCHLIIILSNFFFSFFNNLINLNQAFQNIIVISLFNFLLLYGIEIFIVKLIGKIDIIEIKETSQFMKEQFYQDKKSRNLLIAVISIGTILGTFIYFIIVFTLKIAITEPFLQKEYYILDEKVNRLTNNINTRVVLYQTNEYLITANCTIDLKKDKITIYKYTTKLLNNRNISIKKRSFKQKEIKQATNLNN